MQSHKRSSLQPPHELELYHAEATEVDTDLAADIAPDLEEDDLPPDEGDCFEDGSLPDDEDEPPHDDGNYLEEDPLYLWDDFD